MDLENKYYNPREISSVLILKQIMTSLDKEIIDALIPLELIKFKCELREKIRLAIKYYVEKILSGKIGVQEYAQNLKKTINYFVGLKQEREKSGQKSTKYDNFIPIRVKAIKKEHEILAQEKEIGLKKIVLLSNKNLEQSIYDIINLDKKPFQEKFLLFATRYKQYFNLITYITKNMKDTRIQELNNIYMPMLQRANVILEQYKKGQEGSINDIISKEMLPITRDKVLGMTSEQFNEKLKALFLLIQDCIEREKKFKEFAKNAKKTKEHNWPVYSTFKAKQYQNLFTALNKIDESVRPLPIIEIRDEKRNLIVEDKEVEMQDMVVKFKKLIGCPKGKYMMNFSFELNKAIISDSTDFCNENLEWNYMKKFSRGPDAKNLDNLIHTKTISVNIFKKGMLFGQDEYGRVSIPLTDLATRSSIRKTIQIQHKKDTFELEYEIRLRLCTQLYTPIPMRTLIVVKQFEPFDANQDLDIFLDKWMPEQYRKKEEKQSNQKTLLKQNENDDDIIPKLQFLTRDETSKSFEIFAKLQDNQIPQGLTKDELLYPEELKISFSSEYINLIEEHIKQSSGYYVTQGQFKLRKFANQQIEEVMGRKAFMEVIADKVEAGKVTLEQIQTYYSEAIVRDRLRIECYIKLGLFDWASFCLARRKILIKDMIENEMQIDDVQEINTKEIIQKMKNSQQNEQKVKNVLASIKPQITFLKRGGEFRETTILSQLTEQMLPQGLTMKEALNPEDLDYNYCLSYLELMSDWQAKAQTFFSKQGMQEEKMKAKKLQENAIKLTYGLQNKMESGNLDAEEVLAFYSDGIVRDRLRIQLYMKIRLYEWVSFCIKKREMYIQDMKENEFQIQDVEVIDLASLI